MQLFFTQQLKRWRPRFLRSVALLLPFLLLAAPRPAAAGGWTQPRGTAYLRLEGAGRSVDRMLDADGRSTALAVGGGAAEFRVFETRAYAEYGATDGTTLVVAAAWKHATIDEAAATFRTYGFGDLRLGLRHALLRDGGWPLALEAEITVPTGYATDEIPALGSGRMDAALLLQLGHAFRGGYLTLEAGYRVREQALSDQLPLGAGIGLEAPGPFALHLGARGRVALESAGEKTDPTVAERGLLTLTGGVAFHASDRIEIEALVSDTVSGRNALPGAEFGLAVAVRH